MKTSIKTIGLLCDKDGKNGLRIAVHEESKLPKVGKVEAPFGLKTGEDLVLRVFIDKNFVEVVANDWQAADKYVQEKTSVSLFSKGGDVMVPRVRS
jgi:hypothetical protein